MSLSIVLEQLNSISNVSSTNDKVKLLCEYLKDPDFLTVVRFALSQDKMFNMKKLPGFKRQGLVKTKKEEIFSFLKQLTTQTGASDSDKNKLAQLSSIDPETYEVVNRIISKDLKCGASAKLVNKARKCTINIVPYMRCHTSKKIDNIQYPAIGQEKADGMFVNLMINSKGQIKIITRNGKTVYQLYRLKKLIRQTAARKEFYRSRVYTGELLVKKKGKVLSRKTGNGILNSCISNTANKHDADCVVFRCWDSLPLDRFYEGVDLDTFIMRFTMVKQFVKIINNRDIVDYVLTKQLSCVEDAYEFYERIRAAGGEGIILKNVFGEWRNHTSPNMVKLKSEIDFDLKVVAFNSGKKGSKYASMLGALSVESSCGKLKVNIGSGFSDEQRSKMPDYWLGKIITVTCESIIKDKTKDTYSLFLPRFKELRLDRDKAQSLKDMQER